MRFALTVVIGLLSLKPGTADARVLGSEDAAAAAERLLEQVGGGDAWSQRTLEVEERGFLRSGEAAHIRIVRDFDRGARLVVRHNSDQTFIEWISPTGGWTDDGEARRALSQSEKGQGFLKRDDQ